jgi:hypothetical protein
MPEREYRGQNGTVVLQDKALVIRRGVKGFLLGGGMLRGDKTIPFSSIVAVQLKRAGAVQGYIQFTLLGGPEAKRGWSEALNDENTVSFNFWGGNNEKFAELKNIIEGKMHSQTNVVSDNSSSRSFSSLDELEKLAGLKDRGIITEEEFQQKKKQLLGL